jgi:Insertion element 4 transposase N-terminal/Transposase DDE domain
MEFYPTWPVGASPVPAYGDGGMPAGMVAVRPADLIRPGRGGASALVAGPAAADPVVPGEPLVFCHQVTVAPAVVRRGGEVRAGGWLPDHVTPGVLEAHLPDEEVGELIEDFGCAEQRRRLLPAALAVRLVLAMTLLPDADVTEVIRRAAGLLEHLPWAQPWHVPRTEALTRRREKIPAELFEALFWRIAGPIAAPRAPGMAWNGLLLCALDGFQVRVPDTPANRAYFGSSGTADNSSPFPMVRAVVVTAAGTRGALGLEFGPSSEGEQTLTRRLVKARPGVFGPGRLLLMDRNFPGFALIAQIRREGAHLLMRVKSDVSLPLEEALPDGSYRSFLTDGSSRIPVRVVEYDITVPGRDRDDEVYALATTLMDWQAYPASGLAGCYPNRWKAVETKIGEDKSAITDAGPSRGPILRSTTPHQVCQEMWAWMTSTQLVRMHACQAAQASPGPQPVTPARVSFTLTRREAIRAMTQTLVTTGVSAEAFAAAAERASRAILDRLLPVRPPRHRQRRTKCRQQFPSATGRVPASTGAAAITLYPAGQITYADGRTRPATSPGPGDTS